VLLRGLASCTLYPVAIGRSACCWVIVFEQSKLFSIAIMGRAPLRIVTLEFVRTMVKFWT